MDYGRAHLVDTRHDDSGAEPAATKSGATKREGAIWNDDSTQSVSELS